MSPVVISPILLAIWLAGSFLLGITAMLAISGYGSRVSSRKAICHSQIQPVLAAVGAMEARRFWAVIGLMTGAMIWLFADILLRVTLHLAS